MKIKGARKEKHGENRNRKETTHDEWVGIIALRNSARMTWKEIEGEPGQTFEPVNESTPK